MLSSFRSVCVQLGIATALALASGCGSQTDPPPVVGAPVGGGAGAAGMSASGAPSGGGGSGTTSTQAGSASGGGGGGGAPAVDPMVVTDDENVGPLDLMPRPTSATTGAGHVHLAATTRLVADARARPVAEVLAQVLRRSTSLPFEIVEGPARRGDISLSLQGDAASLGQEGYRLEVGTDRVEARAADLPGLFYATVTLRQLLDARVEAPSAQANVTWRLPRVVIDDAPRFSWRGLSLDVARHFFGKEEVKRLIDQAAFHKLNRVHLHLSDDQGWRIQIDSWPNLTLRGGSTQVGGGPGGYYTKADYAELVSYASARFVTIIPEIDMPGHTLAALASYGELNPSGVAPELYTGTKVGISTLMLGAEVTNRFVKDVLGELAAMTPGPYLHVGGDEAPNTDSSAYRSFIETVHGVVKAHNKRLIGWCEVGNANLGAGTIAQHWHKDCPSATAAARGMDVVLSPATNAYLDMKYEKATPVGADWAGLVSVQQAYEWQPALDGVPAERILGVESALWTEFVQTRADIDLLVFPRLCGHAEIGWARGERTFADYASRLPRHGQRLTAAGVGFYRAPGIVWRD